MPGNGSEMLPYYYPAPSERDTTWKIRCVIHVRVIEVKTFACPTRLWTLQEAKPFAILPGNYREMFYPDNRGGWTLDLERDMDFLLGKKYEPGSKSENVYFYYPAIRFRVVNVKFSH